ncbi:MAG: DUF1667 domain-containing protein [Acutalibacteraceae bacterium]|nr:DUF1667 domain-containing protein [Acutalibacteraceae bacterium]
MEKNIICIICPRGCQLKVTEQNGEIAVSGNACKRGENYAVAECTNPLRTVTSIVRVSNRVDTMVSVKTSQPVPKAKIDEVMKLIRETQVVAPVKIGDVIKADVYGADIIATKNIL